MVFERRTARVEVFDKLIKGTLKFPIYLAEASL